MAAEAGTLLLQFARAPVPGAVKTRLIPRLGPAGACDLHRELVVRTCRTLLDARLGPVELWVEGDTGDTLFRRCRSLGVAAVRPQAGADLGQRMYHALREGLTRHARVLLVGSDCPDLDRHYLASAVGALDTSPVVLGPALDGGYVLIGARQVDPSLFRAIDWGTDRVLAQTGDRLRRLDWSWRALAPLADVDRPEDLDRWEWLPASRGD